MYNILLALLLNLTPIMCMHGSIANWISYYQIHHYNATKLRLELMRKKALPPIVRNTSLDVEFDDKIIKGRWFINRTTHRGRVSLQISSFYGGHVENAVPLFNDSGTFKLTNVKMNHMYQITLQQRTQMGLREILHKLLYTTPLRISQTSDSLTVSWNPRAWQAFEYFTLHFHVPYWTTESFVVTGNAKEFVKPDVSPCTKYAILLKGVNVNGSYTLGLRRYVMATSKKHKCLVVKPVAVTARADDDGLDIYWPPSSLAGLTQWGLTISSDSRTDHVELFRRPAVYRHRIRPNAHGVVHLLGRFSGVYSHLGMAQF